MYCLVVVALFLFVAMRRIDMQRLVARCCRLQMIAKDFHETASQFAPEIGACCLLCRWKLRHARERMYF